MPDVHTELAEMVATLHPGVTLDDEREDAFVLATREREG